jgi:MFS superfamily sulfate permease-like transporter
MSVFNRRAKFYFLSFLKHDFKASITVFFVALPLCLGISLASNAPLYSGLISGILGGIVVGFISKSHISVSGPAAGLTAICASAITELGTIDIFFLSVAVAGLIQVLLGIFRLGGFTHFIPSTVIKGMLAAIVQHYFIRQYFPTCKKHLLSLFERGYSYCLAIFSLAHCLEKYISQKNHLPSHFFRGGSFWNCDGIIVQRIYSHPGPEGFAVCQYSGKSFW